MFLKNSKGKKYLLYSIKTRELNLKGLEASLPEQFANLKLGLGKLQIKPHLVNISDKIREFDAIQASIRADLDKIKDQAKIDEYISKCIDYKLKIMMLAHQAYDQDDKGTLSEENIEISTSRPLVNENNFHNNLYDYFKNAKFEISNFIAEDFSKKGKIIWPVVLQERPTIIHKAQIEAIRILVKNSWELHVLIADCGTTASIQSQKDSFKAELLRQLTKRDVIHDEISFLSDYYSSQPTIGADVLSKFTKISSSLKTKDLIRYNTKEDTYSPDTIKKINQRNALRFIQPLLTWAVIMNISENYANKTQKKAIVIAGQDEQSQWSFIFNKSSSIGGLFNPKLWNENNHIVFQEDQPMIFHNEREVLKLLDVGNLANWLYNSFVTLPYYPEIPKNLSFCKECKKAETCEVCLFPDDEVKVLPEFVDKEKFVTSFWRIIGTS